MYIFSSHYLIFISWNHIGAQTHIEKRKSTFWLVGHFLHLDQMTSHLWSNGSFTFSLLRQKEVLMFWQLAAPNGIFNIKEYWWFVCQRCDPRIYCSFLVIICIPFLNQDLIHKLQVGFPINLMCVSAHKGWTDHFSCTCSTDKHTTQPWLHYNIKART